ncbi:MAG: aspartate carbamoyltransferase regulatory subunit [Muribaculaceae bacterium]|nr:aspartate carbamoyltransferase regulatory subunit [Muribaculaceae bacterium]
MSNSKKELAVAALRNGTVIDHIPSDALFKCVKILGLTGMDHQLTIGNNLASERLGLGTKGIIKVADVYFPEDMLNRIALVAPTAVVNTIRDYEVAEKRPVALPSVIRGIVKCDNAKCITNNEPMETRFDVVEDKPGFVRCYYCGHAVANANATLL